MTGLKAAAQMDVGCLRDINEDNAWAQVYHPFGRQPIGLFIVCDGMGGHMGGEFASYWAVEAIKSEYADLFSTKDPRATVVLSEEDIEAARSGYLLPRLLKKDKQERVDLEARVLSAVQKANQVVHEYALRKPEKAGNAGTTVTMAFIQGNKAIIANVGDSRTYLLRNHQLRQISQDHSLVANLVSTGQILPEDIFTHPQRNVIYRFLGQKGLVHADIFHESLRAGDYLLLCSDGLWEMVHSNGIMAEIIEAADEPAQACQELINAANAAGGEDNIGVVVVKVAG
ncbi:MAG: serine/threonine-protein phosphatase [Anaerolineales bacterium]|nr:serine/threonine-protein phosphatase [Anaerolineales bacterium]